MKSIPLAALSILLLLAVAAPSCLAAENSASDQQPALQYSKLPPLQFSGSPLTQKEYLQAALWLAQRHSPITTTPRIDEKVFGLTSTEATVLSPIVSAIAIIISIAIAIWNMKKNTSALREDFKFRMYQLGLEEKKKAMLNFFESTSIPALCKENYSLIELETQLTMIEMLMDKNFYDISNAVLSCVKKSRSLIRYMPKNDSDRMVAVAEYEPLHARLANEIRRVLRGEDFDPTLTASK